MLRNSIEALDGGTGSGSLVRRKESISWDVRSVVHVSGLPGVSAGSFLDHPIIWGFAGFRGVFLSSFPSCTVDTPAGQLARQNTITVLGRNSRKMYTYSTVDEEQLYTYSSPPSQKRSIGSS